MMKKFILSALALSSFAQAHLIDEIRARGVLKVAIYPYEQPFAYIEGEEYQGFEVELGKALAQALLGSEKVEFIKVEIADRSKVLLTKEADVTLAVFTQTKLREKAVDFAEPYVKTTTGILSSAEKPITTPEALVNHTVITTCSSSTEQFLKKNYPNVKQICAQDSIGLLTALTRGDATAIAHDNTSLAALAKRSTGYVVSINKLGTATDFIAPAVAKNQPEFLAWLNSEIKAMKKDGRLKAIYEKTFSPVYGADQMNAILDLSE